MDDGWRLSLYWRRGSSRICDGHAPNRTAAKSPSEECPEEAGTPGELDITTRIRGRERATTLVLHDGTELRRVRGEPETAAAGVGIGQVQRSHIRLGYIGVVARPPRFDEFEDIQRR